VIRIALVSDQSYNWSDQYATKIYCHSPAKTKKAPAKPARLGCRAPGLPHRTLQALWKTRVQLRPGPWPWPQVLPLGQQAGTEARDGLCPARLFGKSQRASGQFPQDKNDLGGALRDQSRAPAAQGEAVVRAPACSLRGQCDGNISGRCRTDLHSLRQHARRGAEKRRWPFVGQGGES
jgi:hypothetical protein